MTLEFILAITTGAMGLISGLAGALMWYASRIKREYQAERNYEHLKRNYNQLSQAILTLTDQHEERAQEIQRMLDRILDRLDMSQITRPLK